MSAFLVLWLASLLVLLGTLIYAHRRGDRADLSLEELPENFADFIAIELTRMTGHLSRGATRLRPHGEWMIAQSTVLVQRGHDIFVEKIFGRMEIEKGKAASFFLKRIAEHKEALRQKKRGETIDG